MQLSNEISYLKLRFSILVGSINNDDSNIETNQTIHGHILIAIKNPISRRHLYRGSSDSIRFSNEIGTAHKKPILSSR